MKSWFSKFLRKDPDTAPLQRMRLGTTRFRHLLRQYGQLVSLCADAAEKQLGEYILDKAYLLALSDKSFETALGMIYDLNVLTNQRHVGFYDAVEAIRHRATAIFKADSASLPAGDNAEELEYRLLRNLRGILFAENKDPSSPSLFGVVQPVRSAAGDSIAEMIQSLASLPVSAGTHAGAPLRIKTSVVDLMSGLTGSDEPPLIRDPFAADSVTVREFLESFFAPECWNDRSRDSDHLASSELLALGLEDSMSAAIFHGQGYNLLDAFLSCASDANYIYCRFPRGPEAPVASGILQRLGFLVSGTQHELTGWIASEPLDETMAKLKALGKMAAFLLLYSSAGSSSRTEDDVDRFFQMNE
jgi:hypothetical protein